MQPPSVDATLRAARRAAASGGIEERAQLLRLRLQTGDLSRERVELAAYCGDGAALSVVGWCCWTHGGSGPEHLACDPLYDHFAWLEGLNRWGHDVMTRAAIRAGEVALVEWEANTILGTGPRADTAPHGCTTCKGQQPCYVHASPRVALGAARAWLEDPSEPLWHAWNAWIDAHVLTQGYLEWLPDPRDMKPEPPRRIRAAARFAGEAKVRAAIREELVTWALR